MAVNRGHVYVKCIEYVRNQGQNINKAGIYGRLIIRVISFVDVQVNAA